MGVGIGTGAGAGVGAGAGAGVGDGVGVGWAHAVAKITTRVESTTPISNLVLNTKLVSFSCIILYYIT